MIHLISPADVVANTVISLGSEPHKLRIAIPLAQGKYLRPLLGLQLFDELLTFAESAPDYPAQPNATTLAAYNTARAEWLETVAEEPMMKLLKEATPMLCAWTVIEAWPSLLVHVEAAGVTVKTGKSEGTSSADAQLVSKAFDGLQSTAVFHSEELDTWLKKNRSTYAEFLPQTPAATGRLPIGGVCFE